MTIHTSIPDVADMATDAVELEGLALAMRIVVADYLSSRSLEKCNALDALVTVLHEKTKALGLTVDGSGVASHV